MTKVEENQIVQDEQIDDVLQSVSDEFLKKKNRKRKITLAIISAVILAFSIVIITLSCVRVDLKPYFIEEPTQFSINIDGKTLYYDSSDENYNEFYSEFLKTFEITYMSAIFTGCLQDYKIVETSSNFYKNNTVNSAISSDMSSLLGSNYVHLYYIAEQKLYNANGQVCTSKYNSSQELKYVDIYFPLSTEDQIKDLTFYFGAYGDSQPRITKLTIKVNSYSLYNYLINQ